MNNKVIFETTDPQKRTILLYEDTWSHIKTKHPEVARIQDMKSTIQKPDFITEISERTSLVYTRISSSTLHYNVYAKMDDTYRKGTVKSTYLTVRPPGGEVIWYQKT